MLRFDEYVKQHSEVAYEKATLPTYSPDADVLEAVPNKGNIRTKLPNQNSMLVDLGSRINLIGVETANEFVATAERNGRKCKTTLRKSREAPPN